MIKIGKLKSVNVVTHTHAKRNRNQIFLFEEKWFPFFYTVTQERLYIKASDSFKMTWGGGGGGEKMEFILGFLFFSTHQVITNKVIQFPAIPRFKNRCTTSIQAG